MLLLFWGWDGDGRGQGTAWAQLEQQLTLRLCTPNRHMSARPARRRSAPRPPTSSSRTKTVRAVLLQIIFLSLAILHARSTSPNYYHHHQHSSPSNAHTDYEALGKELANSGVHGCLPHHPVHLRSTSPPPLVLFPYTHPRRDSSDKTGTANTIFYLSIPPWAYSTIAGYINEFCRSVGATGRGSPPAPGSLSARAGDYC